MYILSCALHVSLDKRRYPVSDILLNPPMVRPYRHDSTIMLKKTFKNLTDHAMTK